jgi:CubicO group peptidase (beta-lactamase class C family)
MGAFYDWDAMVERYAAEAPFWEPGTRHGYHAHSFGFLVGEVIRRITGARIDEFFAAEVAVPLGLDLWIGLPASEHHRVAQFLPPAPPAPGDPISRFTMEMMTDPTSLAFVAAGNMGGYLLPGEWDSPASLSAVIPSSGGVGNARSLATMYRAIVHDRAIGRFTLEPEDIAQMGAVQSAEGEDAVLHGPGRWALGFHKGGWSPRSMQPPVRVSLSEEAFGHTGFGGSIGFADPACDMSFAYVMNQMDGDMGLSPKGQSLVDAMYEALGYRRGRYDIWTR